MNDVVSAQPGDVEGLARNARIVLDEQVPVGRIGQLIMAGPAAIVLLAS